MRILTSYVLDMNLSYCKLQLVDRPDNLVVDFNRVQKKNDP